MTPLDAYKQQITSGLIQQDDKQTQAVKQLQKTYLALMKREEAKKHRLTRFLPHAKKPVTGLYLWGSVGVGKTFLMDLFYHCLPEHPFKKKRMHFHQFMRRIHYELKAAQGKRNPLQHIAKKLAGEACLLCFDEFLVSDIADAMILGQLFKALFNEGLCLITSANVPPDDLYQNGLQRERFLPAIEQIKQHATVLHMTSQRDYRIHHIEQAGVYHTPLNTETDKRMKDSFRYFTKTQPTTSEALTLFGRNIVVQQRTDDVIWFDFNDICRPPRSQKDYLALAEQYKIVFISNVPTFTPYDTNRVAAFIHLVDVFYDAKVRLVLSAQTDVRSLYPGGELTFDFARTQSRLIEMQSADYFETK